MEPTLKEINIAKEYLESIKTRLQNNGYSGSAVEIINSVIMKIKIGPMTWFNINEQFSELNEDAKALNRIVNTIKSKPQSEAEDLAEALDKVEKAGEELNKLKDHLKTNALDQARATIEVVEKIKAKVNANPDDFAAELEKLEEIARTVSLEAFEIPKQLTNLMKKNYLETILRLWSAEGSVESLKLTYPSEADQLKQMFIEVETKFYSLRKDTSKLLNKVKWRLNAKSDDEEPPDEVLTLEKCNMYTHVCTVEDLSESVVEVKSEIIVHLGELFEAKVPEILEHINHVTEEFRSKYPEDKELESFVEEKKVTFNEMRAILKTVTNKITLDAENGTPGGVDLAGFYTEMFLYVLKAKVLPFLDIRLSEVNIYELAPVREENQDAKKEFMEEISEGSLREFTTAFFEHFSYESMLEQEMQTDEYEYLKYL